MAQIPRSSLDGLTQRLNALSEEGKRLVRNALRNAEWDTVAELREILVEAMEAVCATVSDHSAALTAEFYDGLREGSVGEPLGAVPASGRDPKATEGAVRAFMQSVVETGATDALEKRLCERVDYEAKRASGECVKANADADPLKPRFARVPTGAETCGFCIMLASRGFVYRSAEAAGEVDHYHANCDCRIVPGFPGDEVEGYDPDLYYDMWKHPEKYDGHSDEGFLFEEVDSYFPIEKLSGYSLNPQKAPEKARAWNTALGFSEKDSEVVRELVVDALKGKRLRRNGYNGYGALYYADVTILGKNGKTARVRTSWMVSRGSDKMKLTSVYVKRKKGGAGNED